MKYILNKDYALRSYKDNVNRLIKSRHVKSSPLSKEEYEALLLCDGEKDIPLDCKEREILNRFLKNKLIRPAGEGDALTPWQRPKSYDNHYMPWLILQITGKCNYNCLHCFNAKDNDRLNSELSLPQIIHILDEVKDCGFLGVTITGGEPLVHKDIREIFKAVYDRGLFVENFYTTGVLITQDFLSYLKSIGALPRIKISFDGVGFHDWMRNKEGTEAETLDAIRLCVKNGFSVSVQTQFNCKNIGCIKETLDVIEATGAESVRIIRTSESSRWLENAGDSCLSFKEYYDTSLALLEDYINGDHHMKVNFWQFAEYDPDRRLLYISQDRCQGYYYKSRYICPSIRSKMSVAATGSLYPCIQCSGTFERHGISFGTIFDRPLKETLSNSKYFDTINYRTEQRRTHNEKCQSCSHFEKCSGGCPALGFLTSGDFFGIDKSKCYFYEEGYYDKLYELKMQLQEGQP